MIISVLLFRLFKKVFTMRNGGILFIVAAFACLSKVDCKTFDFVSVWFQRPYNGPEIIVEVIGADMNQRANRFFDYWSKPDIMVTFHHGDHDEHTQIEGNTFQPRFLYKTKIPYRPKYGLHFHVMEANVLKGNQVMGRAFIDKEQITALLNSGQPALLSLGENIGVVMIRLFYLPKQLKEKDKYGRTKVAPLALQANPPPAKQPLPVKQIQP
jgi:hypothetical protein